MKNVSHNARLVQRAYWLIRLRWIAIAATCITIFTAHNVLGVSVQHVQLYCVTAALALENLVSLLLLKRTLTGKAEKVFITVGRIVDFQISVDLVALAVLLHYSGGIENPFIVYFIFHMVIASILLSAWESYLQATLAVLLITFLALLEYRGIIPHYCLKGFVAYDFHDNGLHLLVIVGVLASMLYLVVYMTSNIAAQLRKQEEAYRQANIQLKQKDRIKDEYVSRVTHDIKGHLAAIQSCLDVVVSKSAGILNDKQANFIGRAHSRTKKLAYFVRTLLELTQMRLSRNLAMDLFSLKNTIYSAVAATRARANDKSIHLSCDIEPGVEKIFGNRFSIEEVITNLLLNAIKYTPENGTVTVGARDEKDCVLVAVSDSGIGIPEDEKDKVFDEFYRASNAKELKKDGTGLGLSIVKQIVERHGGRIWVESIENYGTTFWFALSKEFNSRDDTADYSKAGVVKSRAT